MKAIEIIEPAKSYYLLSNDHPMTGSKPILVGNRVKLEFALEKIKSDMIIATSGNDERCIVLVDFSTDDCWLLAQKAQTRIRKIKAKN